jgi:hypothetical protein
MHEPVAEFAGGVYVIAGRNAGLRRDEFGGPDHDAVGGGESSAAYPLGNRIKTLRSYADEWHAPVRLG